MPVTVRAEIIRPSEQEFVRKSYAVIGRLFDVHNTFGRFFDEKVYRMEAAAECSQSSFGRVQTEVPVDIVFRGYTKTYYLDLLIDGGVLFELKALKALNDEHRAQVLNYLFLTGLPRAKLVNLGSHDVEHEFVSTSLTLSDRRQFRVDDSGWEPVEGPRISLKEILVELLEDLGCCLSLNLYRDAIHHEFGGEMMIGRIPVRRSERLITTQRVHLLSGDVAFKVTGVRDHLDGVEKHLLQFLSHTDLKAIQWVNLNQMNVQIKTLLKA